MTWAGISQKKIENTPLDHTVHGFPSFRHLSPMCPCRLYKLIFQPETDDFLEPLEAIVADWMHDSQNEAGVSYEWFHVSLFELADNWAPAVYNTIECHADFLNEYFPKVFDVVRRPVVAAADWDAKHQQIVQSYERQFSRYNAPVVFPVVKEGGEFINTRISS